MTPALHDPIDHDSTDFIEVLDDLPLWSAPFGLKILEHINLADGIRVLDIGSGCGFPLVEVAQRVGPASKVYGVDPWNAGLDRIRRKIEILGLKNVQAIRCTAEDLPFAADFFDTIISNNGLNNVADQRLAFQECYRTARIGAQLLFTVNLPETMSAFYAVFKMTLRQAGLERQIEAVKDHIYEKRKPLSVLRTLLFESGWMILREETDSFTMRYFNGSVMLRHFLIRTGFLPGWMELIPAEQRTEVLGHLEQNLNKRAAREGVLPLEVPFVCIECRKGTM